MRKATFLVGIGLLAQGLRRVGRSRKLAELERLNAKLGESLDAEKRRAADLVLELVRAREQFENSLSRVNDLFWTVEVLADGQMTVTYLSADASGVVGTVGRAGLDARALREDLRHPDDAEANAEFTAAMLAGKPAEVEERLIGYDGITRWTWSRGVPRHEGDRLFFDGITTNITERHLLDTQREEVLAREREQVAMLEEMHRTRDDFIALAGHELRTPLTVIQGYAEHLLEDPAIGSEQHTQLDIVVRRARSMSDLIDDLFDLAKLDAPLSTIAFASVPLDEVVEESVEAHRPMSRQLNIGLQTVTKPVHVVGDRGRLRRMCDNLLDNAVKFSPSARDVTVVLTQEGDEAVLVVADRGIGIPSDEVAHVFERLYRATNATESRYPGTGLGLSIALATAESHGGTASADNRPEGGAVFTVRLPAHEASEPHTRD